MKKAFKSFHSKMVLFVVFTSCVSALTMGLVNYVNSRSEQQRAAIEKLLTETVLASAIFESEFGKIARNARFLAETQIVSEITSLGVNKPDFRLDGEAMAYKRYVLEQVFESLLQSDTFYWQARLISFDDGDQELVRMNRIDGELVPVPVQELQKKENEYYVQQAKILTNDDFFFTRVTANREHGKVDANSPLMLRAIARVKSPNGKPFGLVVLNINYEEFIKRTFSLTGLQRTSIFFTHHGEFTKFDPVTRTSSPLGRVQDDMTEPHIGSFLDSPNDKGWVVDGDVVQTFQKFWIGDVDDTPPFVLVEEISIETILSSLNHFLEKKLWAMAILIPLIAMAAASLTSQFTRPIRAMAKSARQYQNDDFVLALPTSRTDEVGELAQAIAEMNDVIMVESARAHALFAEAIDSIITINKRGIIKSVNPAAVKLFGYSASEMVGNNVKMLMHEEVAVEHDKYLERYHETGEKKIIGIGRETLGKRKNGETFSLDLSVSEVTAGKTVYYAGMIRDISERKESEIERDRLVEALSRSNEELDNFAYVASHDLKAPLRVINNAAMWLAEDLEPHLNEESRENIDLLQSRAVRMEKLLDDLLEHSRIGRKLNYTGGEVINGKKLIDTVLDLVSFPPDFTVNVSAGFRDIEIPLMPLQVIFLNLVSNAVKHRSSDTGVICISLIETDAGHEFCVSDDGEGVPPEYHDEITCLFTTMKPRDVVEGSGMGLAIVRKHLAVANAPFNIESTTGNGFTFRFHWPKSDPTIEMERLAS